MNAQLTSNFELRTSNLTLRPNKGGVLALLACLLIWTSTPAARRAADTIPNKLSDQEFWKLSEETSEPNGFFRSDNLLSNEMGYPSVLSSLVERTRRGSVYMGVGPEQNFHYIAAIKPKMVFIVDIRRGNLHLQLMYKALFELSADRAEFFSRLFTKKRPDGIAPTASVSDLVNAYWNVPTSEEPAYKQNLQAIYDLLTKKHNLPLTDDDLAGIEYVYHSFYWYGPNINYSSSQNGGNGGRATYAELMMATDGSGLSGSYLANEERFATLKDLESKNLIVPVVGNFGGPKTIRAVGKYVRDHGAIVTAFYLSNVEQYLSQDGSWNAFCANVATLPLDENSTFIRSRGGMWLGAMQAEVKSCGSGVVSSVVR